MRDAATAAAPEPGCLSGLTIMRYAHIYRDRKSGGVEQYLRRLNKGLLERHDLTIVQMYLVPGDRGFSPDTEYVGRGRIRWVPVPVRGAQSFIADLPMRFGYVCGRLKAALVRSDQRDASARRTLSRELRVGYGHLRHKTAIFSDRLRDILCSEKVDLLAVHWLTYDTDSLLSMALGTEVPFVLINHFANERFELPQMRRWATRAVGIGGVSSQAIPKHLQSDYVNLSDAVDTDIFAPEKAKRARFGDDPLVLLPGRIDARKGHRDLILAATRLIAGGGNFTVLFAGAVESRSLYSELVELTAAKGLRARIRFLGEVGAEEMRELYASSSVVVLPSYSEGLPRVLLEAQAMGRPVVAYDSGGVRDAVVDDETGFLVGRGNIDGLVDKIALLLRDDMKRRRMGECGRRHVLRAFGLPALIERHERFYLSALAATQVGRLTDQPGGTGHAGGRA